MSELFYMVLCTIGAVGFAVCVIIITSAICSLYVLKSIIKIFEEADDKWG